MICVGSCVLEVGSAVAVFERSVVEVVSGVVEDRTGLVELGNDVVTSTEVVEIGTLGMVEVGNDMPVVRSGAVDVSTLKIVEESSMLVVRSGAVDISTIDIVEEGNDMFVVRSGAVDVGTVFMEVVLTVVAVLGTGVVEVESAMFVFGTDVVEVCMAMVVVGSVVGSDVVETVLVEVGIDVDVGKAVDDIDTGAFDENTAFSEEVVGMADVGSYVVEYTSSRVELGSAEVVAGVVVTEVLTDVVVDVSMAEIGCVVFGVIADVASGSADATGFASDVIAEPATFPEVSTCDVEVDAVVVVVGTVKIALVCSLLVSSVEATLFINTETYISFFIPFYHHNYTCLHTLCVCV